jgi:hypothetical protein
VFVFTHTMPGEGGVCGVVVDAVLLGVLLVVFAGVVLAGVVEAVVVGLLGVAATGVVAGFAAVVVVAGFVEVEVVVGFVVVDAVLLVEVEVDLLEVAGVVLPVVGLVVFAVFDFEVLLVELELEEEVVLPVVCVLWANSAAEPTVPTSRAPRTREAISFLTVPFILSPYSRP